MTWRLPTSLDPTDSAAERLRESLAEHPRFFEPGQPVWLARAPGRLDLMGGFGDYSGSRVLEMPTAEATFCAVQRLDDDAHVQVLSANAAEEGLTPQVRLPLETLRTCGYQQAHEALFAKPAEKWAAYAVGTLMLLAHEHGLPLTGGARMMLASSVPVSKGLSSSAAVEVAAMRAVTAAWDYDIEGRDLALRCQRVENQIVGAPCGVMDQITSALGRKDHLVLLRCQPAEVEDQVPLPTGLRIWAIDSGIRHAISGADYGSVRTGTFMGYRMIAHLAGLAPSQDAPLVLDDPRWGGYLANLTPSEYMETFRDSIPLHMNGREFLQRYAGITDPVTTVDPERTYPVRYPVEHAVFENHRVGLMRSLLTSPQLDDESLRLAGELMYQAHASYNACRIGSTGTDRIVTLAREAGPAAGIHGAKITGGGSGGCVAILGHADAGPVIEDIARRYARESGIGGAVFAGSSDGAMAFKPVQLAQSV
jgi:L-arabinokinase